MFDVQCEKSDKMPQKLEWGKMFERKFYRPTRRVLRTLLNTLLGSGGKACRILKTFDSYKRGSRFTELEKRSKGNIWLLFCHKINLRCHRYT